MRVISGLTSIAPEDKHGSAAREHVRIAEHMLDARLGHHRFADVTAS
ncbi:hypothetical protein OHD62_35325 [Mesorhizobium sp. YC-39]|nr:hypothetical protein [Mesorhizobium sp. YC-2]MCV3233604.1 hypothetical protein [Mesorhizobium sp. YC-39]